MQYIIHFSSTFPPLTRSLSPHPKVRVEYPVVVLDIPHMLLNRKTVKISGMGLAKRGPVDELEELTRPKHTSSSTTNNTRTVCSPSARLRITLTLVRGTRISQPSRSSLGATCSDRTVVRT